MSLKISSDTVGNRTRDRQVCSVVLYSLRHRAPSNVIQYVVIISVETEELRRFILHRVGEKPNSSRLGTEL